MPVEITDAMTWDAIGMPLELMLRGRRVLDVVEVVDSDRGEQLLVLDDGRIVLLSCDPAYDDHGQRTPEQWDLMSCDATATRAGRVLLDAHARAREDAARRIVDAAFNSLITPSDVRQLLGDLASPQA